MKLVLAPTYDIYLEDWDMDCINKVAQTYGRVFRIVALRLQHLRGEKPEEIQQFQDTRYQPICGSHYNQLAPTWISNPAPLTSKMTVIDIGRLNIQNKCNDNQKGATSISNQVPNNFISEIRKDCKSISEYSTALAPPAQGLLAQGPSTSAPLAPFSSVKSDGGKLGKHLEQVKIVPNKMDTFTKKDADN